MGPSSKPFGNPPQKPTFPIHNLNVHFPQSDIDDLRSRLNNARPLRTTWENSFTDAALGIRQDWMDQAIAYWRNKYDWREVEEKINKYPNYMASLKAREHEQSIHFTALFSEKTDAVPVLMLHGWPGSFLEFQPLMDDLVSNYSPSDLPIHLICPSHTGYGLSGPPPRHDKFTKRDAAELYDGLMRGLGFDSYVVQAGDFGALIARLMAENFDGCKAIHLNRLHLERPETRDIAPTTKEEEKAVAEAKEWNLYEAAYKREQVTKPATIGIVASSDPVAMLAWIGEKFLAWSDETPSLDMILSNVTLYWLTESFPTGLWAYNDDHPPVAVKGTSPHNKHEKPVGYSLFPKDHETYPESYVKKAMNLVWFRQHDKGGHFAALECPKVLLQDLLDFVKEVWSNH
ncbi:Alpha/Beta hydrolase protein [Kockovaella imperatae]|uniref:Alpha/Beta hydrolase protein n=1 Tax=Kockovaella imperatae TaxID=4999 RepID=A0A1Y1UPX5_9TREE|nr:Alpha/Beta hydrolase protein [Kockovaella imperatae]ORX40073.1 Alpha/Beta hydrolase protein [Kockovaella imperatae]